MLLREFFIQQKTLIAEGGNLASHTPTGEPTVGYKPGLPGVHTADKIDAKNRAIMQPVVKQLLTDINNTFARQYGRVIWNSELLDKEVQEFISGSSKWFMFLRQPNPNFDPKKPVSDDNPKEIGIEDSRFQRVKKKVGDIDTQIDRNLEPQITEFLEKNNGKSIGSAVLAGYKAGTDQWLALWQLAEPPITLQVDLEFADYTTDKRGFEIPTEWAQVSHGSQLEDLEEGIKGVFRQWLYRSLAKIAPTDKYIAKLKGGGKNRAMKLFGGDSGVEPITDINNPPPPFNDANFSFAVASAGGGGVRAKYRAVTPQDGVPSEINGVPVMIPLSAAEADYINDLAQQFEQFFGQPPDGNERTLMYSLVGTVDLMQKYFNDSQIDIALREFFKINFGPGAQMIEADNPTEDFKIKMTAIDYLLDTLGKKEMRKQVLSMADEYESAYTAKKAAVTNQEVNEADGQPTIPSQEIPNYERKGIPHLYNRLPDGRVSSAEMKDVDFINLAKEISNIGGTFDGIPITLKVDGAGIRFGKDQSGEPFWMTSSRVEPIRLQDQGSFLKFNLQKLGLDNQDVNTPLDDLIKQGKIDTDNKHLMTVLNRAQNYDNATNLILNSKFIQTLPNDTIVQAEMLYNPMAENVDGLLKFSKIAYDPKKLGKTMTLVPITVKQYSNGEGRPDQEKIIQKLLSSSTPDVKFITNKLEQKGIDVRNIIDPVVNMDPNLVAALTTKGSNPQKDQAKKILDQARQALSSAIIDNPKLKGKDALGNDMEGIVVAMPNGTLFKVTSQKMKAAMANQMATQSFGDTNPRTAVVAVGNFAGHIGHEALINFGESIAQKEGGKLFVYVGKKVGEKDPIDMPNKLQTLQKLFPNANVSPVENQATDSGEETAGTHMKKIEYELVKKAPFYNNIIIVVGSDAAVNMNAWAKKLQMRFSKFPPLAHVKISVEALARGSEEGGIDASTTLLRDALANDSITVNNKTIPTKTEEQKFAVWSRFYNVQKLGADWIKHLMSVARKNMKLPAPVQQQQLPTQNLAEEYIQIKSLLIERIIQNEFRRS